MFSELEMFAVKMHFGVSVIVICVLVFENSALNCRTDGGPKEDELKRIFQTCMHKMDGASNESSRGMERNLGRNGMDQGAYRRGQDAMGQHMGKDKNSNRSPDGMYDGSSQSDESTSEYPNFNSYRLTTSASPSRRYRRERARMDTRANTGHRSQYNPNTSQRPGNSEDSSYGSLRNNMSDSSSNMSMSDKSKACIAHCFMEDMQMTGENGMPDRYMVTNVITKDIKNEDLKDFLQESIEECFQILYNENTQDKCEFAKNLMLCLSEKGKSNCDDWREEDMHF